MYFNDHFPFITSTHIFPRRHSKRDTQTKKTEAKRSLDDSEKNLNPLDKIEKATYKEQIKKIAYAMTIPLPSDPDKNIKIKVMDHIESKHYFLLKDKYDIKQCF